MAPFLIISKWRCAPVESPVLPIWAMGWPFGHLLPGAYQYFTGVGIHGLIAVAVVDDQMIAVAVVLQLYIRNRAAIRCHDGLAVGIAVGEVPGPGGWCPSGNRNKRKYSAPPGEGQVKVPLASPGVLPVGRFLVPTTTTRSTASLVTVRETSSGLPLPHPHRKPCPHRCAHRFSPSWVTLE